MSDFPETTEISANKNRNNISLRLIDVLADWLDTKFRIPGTKIRFGLDALLSFLPGVGGILGTGATMGVFGLILAKGVPFNTALKMMWNIIVDFVVSSIPLAGVIFDVGFKANVRNLGLLEQHLQNNPDGDYHYGVWMVFGLTLLILVGLGILVITLLWNLLGSLQLPVLGSGHGS